MNRYDIPHTLHLPPFVSRRLSTGGLWLCLGLLPAAALAQPASSAAAPAPAAPGAVHGQPAVAAARDSADVEASSPSASNAPQVAAAPEVTPSPDVPDAAAPDANRAPWLAAPGQVRPVQAATPAAVPSSPEPIDLRPQEDESSQPGWQPETLLGGQRRIDHGGYGSVLIRASSLNDEPALFVGGRGGWLIGHHFLIGGGGMGQTLKVAAPAEAKAVDPDYRHVELGYGGLYLAYHVMAEQLIHPVASLLVGAGGLTLSNRNFHGQPMDERTITVNGVFVVEPEVGAELSVADFMRVQLALSYRRVVGVDLPGLGNGDISGFGGGLALVFGKL